jgi:hypothetical protein
VAVSQMEHAAMCGELAAAWGGGIFGPVEPAEELRLAAAEHELGWIAWDRSPTLNPATGLPFTVIELDLEHYIQFQLDGPQRLAERSPYAALLTVHHHMSFYERPRDELVRTHLERSATYRDELRARVDARDDEIDRNWRLIRAWDGISHELLYDWLPARRPVPDAEGNEIELRLERRDGAFTLEPWPFTGTRLKVHATGRLLETTFTDDERMQAALAEAPQITLEYELAERSMPAEAGTGPS